MAVELRHLGGALGRLPLRPNCVGGRDAEFLVGLVAHEPRRPAEVVPAHCRRVFDTLAPWTADVVPINYVNHTTSEVSPWSPVDHARLRQIKRDHDPANTFRVGPTVQP
jgi:hypothetical protein